MNLENIIPSEGTQSQNRTKIVQFHLYKILRSMKAERLVTGARASSFPDGSDGKESASNAGHPSLIPGLGRFPGEGHGNHSSIPAWRIPGTEEPGGL